LTKTEIEELLQDYVIHVKKKVSPNSILGNISAMFKFLDVNGKEFNRKKILVLLPERVKVADVRAITTDELRLLLEFTPKNRDKALIHFIACNGARPEAVAELRMMHLSEIQEGCMSVVLYAGSKNELVTFLHSEAVLALKKYFDERLSVGEYLESNSFVFRKSDIKTRNGQKVCLGIQLGVL